ncbi:MAG: hypothetical protein F6K55_03160 [Moorea sp. SIO4A3]|nr:hypothetical protein [Moorena sp. SIO4A3]
MLLEVVHPLHNTIVTYEIPAIFIPSKEAGNNSDVYGFHHFRIADIEYRNMQYYLWTVDHENSKDHRYRVSPVGLFREMLIEPPLIEMNDGF